MNATRSLSKGADPMLYQTSAPHFPLTVTTLHNQKNYVNGYFAKLSKLFHWLDQAYCNVHTRLLLKHLLHVVEHLR